MLSDWLGKVDLSFWPQVGLVIFLCVFFTILVRVVFFSKRSEAEEAAQLPLEDDADVRVIEDRAAGSAH
jgi:cbb3-type cytochrome oxidase subunit 3